MLTQIFALTIKELKVLLRDRGALVALFLLPAAFILVMTTAMQGMFASGSSNNPVPLLVVNQDQGQVAARVLTDLKTVDGLRIIEQQGGQPLTRSTAEDLITAQIYSIALVFPLDFSARILDAADAIQPVPAKVTFVTDPAVGSQLLSPVRGMVQGYIEREAMLAQAPRRTLLGFNQMASQAPASQAPQIQKLGSVFTSQFVSSENIAGSSSGVEYQVISPASYQQTFQPTSAEQNVPGYTVYGVFFIMQTIALSLFREKNDGTFRRIQAAPLSRVALLTGKLLPYFLINLVQVALMFTVGVLIFHMRLGHDPLALLVLSLATAAAATGMGLLLASLTHTQEQAGSLGTLLAVVLSALGGSMVPVYVMPDFMQTISRFTPHSWALNGFQDLIVRGLGLSAILPAVGVLLAFAAGFWGIALWRFRFE
ncbi:MAG TPA: ABC-2 transporter permease [Anaerolineaceae bacterium]|nr:ABC-2 transporter permease [Anaerolineaceae bacterium]